jgi:ABC-type nitrate/sulfonate/bicarbonate transport system permease component
MKSKKLEAYSPLILFVILVALWQAICSLFNIPEFIFPLSKQLGRRSGSRWLGLVCLSS